MNYSSRFFLYAPFALLIGLAAIVMLWWWHVSDGWEKRLDSANGHDLAPGIRVTFASRQIGGFPFRLDTFLDNVEIDVATSSGPFVWRCEHFAMHELTYGRTQQIFEMAGRQSLAWTDADGSRHEFAFMPGAVRASAIAVDHRLARFDLDLMGIGSRELSGARVQFHMRRAPDADALDIALSADALQLAPDLQAGFGRDINRLEMVARLSPAAPFAALRAGTAEWRSAAEGWRLQSGRLRLEKFDIAWGRMTAAGTGTLSLGPTHRPTGTLALDLTGAPSGPTQDDKLAEALARAPSGRVTLTFDNGAVSARAPGRAALPAGGIAPVY